MCDLEAEDSGDSDDNESCSDQDWFESDFIDDDDAAADNGVYDEGLDRDFNSEDEEEYFSESEAPSIDSEESDSQEK